MTTKYDHIKLGRSFRPHVLSELKALSTWQGYLNLRGWNKRSSAITGDDIRQACIDLGYDLNAAFVAFFSNPTNLHPGAPTVEAAALAAERINEREDEEMNNEAPATPALITDVIPAEGYEGADAETLIAEALAPASAHMTPHLAQMMPGLLRPFVEAATRGPRTVTVTKTVVKSGDGETVESATPDTAVLRKNPLYHAFGVRKSDAPVAYRHAMENVYVSVCDYANAPAIDHDYIWNMEALTQLGTADSMGMNVWTFGPAGIGKTVGAEQYAARLGRPFVRIAIERTTEPQEIIGQLMPKKGGGMEWRDGKLTRAFRMPHAVILIDEPTLLRSGTLAVFQTALDTREIHTATGEVVRAAEGVFIIAADNTAGMGDDSGRYVDTSPVNAAFLDRFALRVEFSYLSAAQETQMLASRAGVHPHAARIMVDYANLTRQNSDAGKLTMGVTPRRLMSWAKTAKAGIASAKAFTASVVTGCAPEDKEALIMLEAQTLRGQHATIDGIVRGSIDPDAPASDATVRAMQNGVSATGLSFPVDGDTV